MNPNLRVFSFFCTRRSRQSATAAAAPSHFCCFSHTFLSLFSHPFLSHYRLRASLPAIFRPPSSILLLYPHIPSPHALFPDPTATPQETLTSSSPKSHKITHLYTFSSSQLNSHHGPSPSVVHPSAITASLTFNYSDSSSSAPSPSTPRLYPYPRTSR